MEEIIIKVLAETMGIGIEEIDETTVLDEITGFDSLQFVIVISELAETYHIDIPLDVAIDAKTVGELIESARMQ